MLRYPFRVEVTPEEEYVGRFIDFPEASPGAADNLDQLKNIMSKVLLDHCQHLARHSQVIPLPGKESSNHHHVHTDITFTLKAHLNNLLVENEMTIEQLARRASMTTQPDVTVLKALDFHHKSAATSMCFALAQFGYYPEITLKKME
jgi:predicted RNase H-like HicB family nuclease